MSTMILVFKTPAKEQILTIAPCPNTSTWIGVKVRHCFANTWVDQYCQVEFASKKKLENFYSYLNEGNISAAIQVFDKKMGCFGVRSDIKLTQYINTQTTSINYMPKLYMHSTSYPPSLSEKKHEKKHPILKKFLSEFNHIQHTDETHTVVYQTDSLKYYRSFDEVVKAKQEECDKPACRP